MVSGVARLADRTLRCNPAPPNRDPERLGQPTAERPKGCLLWLHVRDPADVGCIAALTHEVSILRNEPVSGLVTSSENAAPLHAISGTSTHQLVPSDTKGSVKRFLDHWQPDIAIVHGAPDRPVLFSETKAAKIPLFLVASDRNPLVTGGKPSSSTVSIPNTFHAILASSGNEKRALIYAGFPSERIDVASYLRDTALVPPCEEKDLTALTAILGGRPVWLAADVSASEIPAIEAAQRRTIRAAHRLLLIIVPRDLDDGTAIAGSLETHGWRTALRSAGGIPDENVQVYIADTADAMGLWYRISPITYLGGSFDADIDTADPFGPASLGSAILHGPEVGGAVPRIQRLQAAGASRLIDRPEALGDAVFDLMSPDNAARLAHSGWAVTTEGAPAVSTLTSMINLTLDGEDPV